MNAGAAVMRLTLLRDKMNFTVGLQGVFLQVSVASFWYSSGTRRKQFASLTVQFVLSLCICAEPVQLAIPTEWRR